MSVAVLLLYIATHVELRIALSDCIGGFSVCRPLISVHTPSFFRKAVLINAALPQYPVTPEVP